MKKNNLRLVFPQWQGGDNPPYYLGSKLLSWLAPPSQGKVVSVPVPEPSSSQPLEEKDNMMAKDILLKQVKDTFNLIKENNPDTIVTLGGDCLVSLAPFSSLINQYKERLGVLWIDTHPDIQNAHQYKNAHAHILGMLMGQGDADFTDLVENKLSPKKIMMAGIHDPLPHEQEFLSKYNIRTCSPSEVKSGAKAVHDWIKEEKIECLAIHFDLDVLDPANFRSLLFAKPGRGQHDFGDVAEGKLNIPDVLTLINKVSTEAETVGITIAELLPWDAINLKEMLENLPLLKE